MISFLEINIFIAFGILLAGILVFDITSYTFGGRNIHEKKLFNNFFHSFFRIISRYFSIASKAKNNKISLKQFGLAYLILISCIYVILCSIKMPDWLGLNYSLILFSSYFGISTIVFIFYKNSKVYRNHDVNFVNFFFGFLIIVMNLLITEFTDAKIFTDILNLMSLVFSIYILFYSVKEIYLYKKHKLDFLIAKIYLVTFNFAFFSFYMKFFSFSYFENRLVEIFLVATLSLVITLYVFSDEIAEDQMKKNKIIIRNLFKYSLGFVGVRFLFWNI